MMQEPSALNLPPEVQRLIVLALSKQPGRVERIACAIATGALRSLLSAPVGAKQFANELVTLAEAIDAELTRRSLT
jgi:hypothetical protein